MFKKILGLFAVICSVQVVYGGAVNYLVSFQNLSNQSVQISSTANHINSVGYQNRGTSSFALAPNSPKVPASSYPFPWQSVNEKLLFFVGGTTYSAQEVCCPRAFYVTRESDGSIVNIITDIGEGGSYDALVQPNGIPTFKPAV